MSRSAPRVLLVNHVKWRDLLPNMVVKILLEERHGLRVVLTDVEDIARAADDFRPHLVVGDCCLGSTRADGLAAASDLGARLVLLMPEGRMDTPSCRFMMATPNEATRRVEHVFCWGPNAVDWFTRCGLFPGAELDLAGCYRFDFYREPWRGFVRGPCDFRARHGGAPDRPVVTLASSFWHSKFTDEDLDELTRKYVDDWQIYRNRDELLADRRVEARAVDVMRGLMPMLASLGDRIRLVVRTHPNENVAMLLGVCRELGLTDVAVSAREYLWDVLAHASFHITYNYSTSLFEGWMLDLPTVNVDSTALWPVHALDEPYRAGTVVAETAEVAFEAVTRWLDDPTGRPFDQSARDRYMAECLQPVDGTRLDYAVAGLARLAEEAASRDVARGFETGPWTRAALADLAEPGPAAPGAESAGFNDRGELEKNLTPADVFSCRRETIARMRVLGIR